PRAWPRAARHTGECPYRSQRAQTGHGRDRTCQDRVQLIADPAAWGLAGVNATLAVMAAARAVGAWNARRHPDIKTQASFLGYTLWIAAAVSVAITLM